MLKKRAFTLVEMILVVAVIAVLIAMLLPSVKTVRDKGKQVTCVNNLRNMGQAFSLYAADYDRFLPYCNWDSIDLTMGKGWLYANRTRSAAEDVQAGSFWKYLYELNTYHCPMHLNHEAMGNTQRLTSYLMTGLTQHYGSTSIWFRYSKFPGDGVVMWEANEFRGHWNDGSNFIREGSPQLSFRHFNRANLLSLSGGVESWFSSEYDAESAKSRSRLIYCPFGHVH